MIKKLDERTIKKYCKRYGYSYRYFDDVAIITTPLDEWRLTYIEKHSKILVEHLNRAGNKSGKMQYHSQRYVRDLHYAFKNIIKPHETYCGAYNETFKIKKLLEKHA